MLNIKTLIQNVYSYIVSKIKVSYRTFIALTAIVVAGVLVVTLSSKDKTIAAEDELEEDYIFELEENVATGDESNSQCETENEYCFSENINKIDISEITQETHGLFLSGNILETIVYEELFFKNNDFITDDELTDEYYEEDLFENVFDEFDENYGAEFDVMENYEASDKAFAEMLEPGDTFEGADGTILVANKLGLRITLEDYDCLLRIIQAEAGNQGLKGKILVGNVIINRVRSHRYANDIQGVVFQKGQFSPAAKGGSYYKVTPNAQTEKAVYKILSGVDYSEGAEYFCGKSAKKRFDKRLIFLFKHGTHYFYKKYK